MNTTTNFNGLIDQVRIYNGVVSDVGVAELYAETTSDNDDLTLGGPPETIISANANAGFSIVKYDGSGVSGTKIPHGLSASPNMILIKCISDGSTNWIVHHSSLGNSKYLTLNDSSSQDTYTNWLVPSATTFALNQTFGNANTSGRQYIAYCFHDVAGYNKINEYTGSGSGNTQAVTTGFQPDWILIKDYIGGGSWWIQDSVRGDDKWLKAQSSNAETTVSYVDFTSTGFTVTGGLNDNSVNSKFIYMAFKIN